jgi:acyl carrier protein
MTKEEIFSKIKEILVQEFKFDGDSISLNTSLAADLEFDSLDVFEFIVQIKPFVRANIDPELFKDACTIQNVVDILFPLV